MSRLKESIDVAIKRRKRLEKDLAERDERITELLKELEFHKSQSAKVEGLIDETIKQANQIEDLLAERDELQRLVKQNLA